jgi:hypothetical protein
LKTDNQDKDAGNGEDDGNSSDEEELMNAKLEEIKSARRSVSPNGKGIPELSLASASISLDGGDSLTKSVRFQDHEDSHTVGGMHSLEHSSDTSSPRVSPRHQISAAITEGSEPEGFLITKVWQPISNILEDIAEVGVKRYSNRMKVMVHE